MRKNKILGGIAVLAIATVAAFNVNFNSQNDELSLLSLDDLEAMATLTFEECGGNYYAPDCRMSVSVHSYQVTSNWNGEIEVNGVVKGGFGRNKTFSINYAVYNCIESAGACCDTRDVRVVSL